MTKSTLKKNTLKKRVKTISKPSHFWKTDMTLVGHTMPLIRIFLILRKFRVEVVSVQVKKTSADHWKGSFVLDYRLSNRIDTVFKKMARLYDVAKLRYGHGKTPQKYIILK